MQRIQRKFWAPSVTSQFCVCPIPFHFDTYRGCTYGCTYCFARDLTRFARRNKDAKDGYRYNEKTRDIVMKVESEDEKAPSAWIWVYLEGKNKVRISIDRFKP